MKIDFFDFSGLSGSNIGGVNLTADDIMCMKELSQDKLEKHGRIMTAEEAEALFYENNDCLSDDYDKELVRIEKWCDDMGIVVAD